MFLELHSMQLNSGWMSIVSLKGTFVNKYGHKKEQFSRTEHNTNLNINGKIIRTSDSLKILGVTIDNKLNFNETHQRCM